MHTTATTALGSLAALAVMTLAAPASATPATAASAEQSPCGTPAIPAVFTTVEHPAVFTTVEHPAVVETVPAVTHQEWLWTRTQSVTEHKYQRTVTETLVEWKRDAGVVEYEWVRTVLVSEGTPGREAVEEQGHWETEVVTPAVVVTEYLYVNARNDNPNARTEYWTTNPNWNAESNPKSLGWTKTDQTREVEVEPAVTREVWVVDVAAEAAVPAVPATYDEQTAWAAARPAGDGWARTGESRTVVISGVELQRLPLGETPDGDGWYETGVQVDGRSHVENGWFEVDPGGDWVATGQQRPGREVTETTATHSATAPGAGWTKVAQSVQTVVDRPATTVTVSEAWTEQKLLTPAWTEQVEVTPAVPAGPECPVVVVDPPVDTPPVETPADEPSESEDTGEEPTTEPVVLGVEVQAQPAHSGQPVRTAKPSAQTAPVAVPTVVDAGLTVLQPAPGTDWRRTAGLVALAAGAALYVVPARRRPAAR